MPSCAIRADSMLRTTCLAATSLRVSTWISLTSPCGVTTTLADNTPVRLVSRFSARFTPHGSGIGGSPWSPDSCADLEGVTSLVSRRHLVAPRRLGPVQRPVGGHEHVLPLAAGRRELGHADTHRHQPRRITQRPADRLHARPHLLPHAAWRSTSFPASCPNLSFTCLKLSRSTNSTANASALRLLRATSFASRSR